MTALLRLERRLVTHSDMLLPPPSKALLPVLFNVCARTTRSPPRITPVLSTVGAVISSRFLELISPAFPLAIVRRWDSCQPGSRPYARWRRRRPLRTGGSRCEKPTKQPPGDRCYRHSLHLVQKCSESSL